MPLPEGAVKLAAITITQALDPTGKEAVYVSTDEDEINRTQLIGMLMIAIQRLVTMTA